MLKDLVFLGAGVQAIGVLFYIKKTLKGDVKPNRVTWLLWFVAPMIGVAAALEKGVGWSMLPVFMSGFGPFLVFLASFVNPKAYWKLEKFDYICGLFSVLALILWAITKQPLIAIIFSIISDAFAGLPTIIKAWRYPETEAPQLYAVGIFSLLTGFFAITNWNFASLAFPAYLILANTLLILAAYHKNLIKILS